MRVAVFIPLDGPDGVSILEQPAPEPGGEEALVDVEAAAINRHDLWILEGDSAMVEAEDLPFVSGLDLAGEVREVGAEVTGLEPGDRVVRCPNETCRSCPSCREGPENRCRDYALSHGGLAEVACVTADRLVPLPDAIDATTAAALPTAYMTALHMLRRAAVEPTDLVFVPGATGGVGLASIQLAAIMGARTVGSSRSASKLERVAAAGLDVPIQATDPEDLRERVLDVVGRPDVVLNHLGGPYTAAGLDVLRRGGRMVVCGRTAGRHAEIDISDLFLQHKQVIGSTMGTQGDLETLVDLVASGDLEPVIDRTFPLEETGEAFATMQRRDSVGKLVVTT